MNTIPFSLERIFDADQKTLWMAITEKEIMKLWYFDLPEFKAEVGFTFQFTGGPEDGTQYVHICEVTEVIPEKRLTYSWRYLGYEGASYLTFELVPMEKGTKLILTHSGLATFPSSNPDFSQQNFAIGWNHLIHTSLKQYIEKAHKLTNT